MAKLSKKVSNDTNNSPEKNKLSFSLSTKTEKKDEEKNISNEKNTEHQQEETIINIPENIEALKKVILEKLNLNDKILISANQLDEIFHKEIKPSDKEINKIILDKIFNNILAERIRHILSELNIKVKKLQSEIREKNEKIQKQDTLIKNLSTQIEDAEELAFKTAKKYSSVIPIDEILNIYISGNMNNEYTQKIKALLLDSYKNGGKNGEKFMLKFAKAFIWIDEAIINLTEDEKKNIDILNKAGKNFFSEISGTNSAERRPLLDIVAILINSFLNEYDFISPEQTLQIDPSIHNAEGLGGTSIKEGLSFAVVRRETHKTVYYADIVSN